MSRYFAELSYLGTQYAGWQTQPNALTIQACIESSLQKISQQKIVITGCGRTDSGVHASQYYIHFDYDGDVSQFHYKLNRMLPKDIAIKRIFQVSAEAHARFDAISRTYHYDISIEKNPFIKDYTWIYRAFRNLDQNKMDVACETLMRYNEFFPFCKTNHDAKTLVCEVSKCHWEQPTENIHRLVIQSNRFLRGMVRMITGMCINIGSEQITLSDLKDAMDNQTMLKRSYSVPAEGLSLVGIEYPREIVD